MKFGLLQQQIFGTAAGAYSPVTATEVGDSQITLTDFEADLVVEHFGADNIYVGNVRSNPRASLKQFRLYPSGNAIELNLIYPKPGKGELRLYLRKGFKPGAGDIWFVFRRDSNLFLGSMTETVWRSLGRDDEEDDRYVSLATEPFEAPVGPRRVLTLQYPRDPVLARKRFEIANYQCEFDPKHKLFTSRATGRNFLEPHHLVMVSLQSRFPGQRLDILENIFALCPWCHRAVHHAEYPFVGKIVATLLSRRENICSRLSLSTDAILRLYNCEQITK